MTKITFNGPCKEDVLYTQEELPEYTFFYGVFDSEPGLFYKSYKTVMRISESTAFGRPQEFNANSSLKFHNVVLFKDITISGTLE